MNFNKKMSDQELRDVGVSEDLITYREGLNTAIKSGKCYSSEPDGKLVLCERAFISNPFGYDRVFLLGEKGEILTHFSPLKEETNNEQLK